MYKYRLLHNIFEDKKTSLDGIYQCYTSA